MIDTNSSIRSQLLAFILFCKIFSIYQFTDFTPSIPSFYLGRGRAERGAFGGGNFPVGGVGVFVFLNSSPHPAETEKKNRYRIGSQTSKTRQQFMAQEKLLSIKIKLSLQSKLLRSAKNKKSHKKLK